MGLAWLGQLSWLGLWGEYHEESRKDSRVSRWIGINKVVGTAEAGGMMGTSYSKGLGGMNKRGSAGVGKF